MKLVFAEIQKFDEEQRIVEGYASTAALDAHNEIIEVSAIEEALADYLKFSNIREMHQPSAVGKCLEAFIDDKGLYIKVKVVDENAWLKVKEGVYKGFSIGGKALAKVGNKIIKLLLSEISLVDRPANPEALFTMFKMVDEQEQQVEMQEEKQEEQKEESIEKGDDMQEEKQYEEKEMSAETDDDQQKQEEAVNAIAEIVNQKKLKPTEILEMINAKLSSSDEVSNETENEEVKEEVKNEDESSEKNENEESTEEVNNEEVENEEEKKEKSFSIDDISKMIDDKVNSVVVQKNNEIESVQNEYTDLKKSFDSTVNELQEIKKQFDEMKKKHEELLSMPAIAKGSLTVVDKVASNEVKLEKFSSPTNKDALDKMKQILKRQ